MKHCYLLLLTLLLSSFVCEANIDTIAGPLEICAGSSVTYSNATAGGVWSTGASGLGTIDPVTGVLSTHGGVPGTVTIFYTAGSEIATTVVTLDVMADVLGITGPNAVCVGSTITLSPLFMIGGGTWSTSNSNATITSGGVLTGVTADSVAVLYTITNACGPQTAFHWVTVQSPPDPGTISGADVICDGSTTMLSATATGGTWSTANGSTTVTGGTVTGVYPGIDTIKYSVSNSCGTFAATHAMTIDPDISTLTISGAHSVCAFSNIVLSSSIAGGTWSASNTNATVSGGVVTGAVAGVDTIMYTITNSCGTNMATYTVTINPLPAAGSISGLNMVCQGATVTLTSSAPGGVWTLSNSNATITSGAVTGVTPGGDTVIYIVTNSCGTAAAVYVLTVNPAPDAGSISGAHKVCAGSTITLMSTGSGGVWSVLNSSASVSGGIVTGITEGVDTIVYTALNSCGVATATYVVTVNDVPAVAPISGANTLCEAATTTLGDATAGGIWSVNNSHASVAGGIITGNSEGIDTVRYTVSNTCGSVAVTYEITINPLPVAGALSGPSIVCVGSAITLTNTGSGGVWSAANSNASVSDGVVISATVGIDTIQYTVTNSCGSAAATHEVSVNDLPSAGFISGASAVCEAASTEMTDAVTGGVWSASNSNVTVSGGLVIGVSAGSSNISYTVTNVCGSDVATKGITVNPLPMTGAISGPGDVCPGNVITLTASLSGGAWAASNSNVIVSSTGDVTGVTPGLVIVSYSFTNACGTAAANTIIAVDPLPYAGVITGTSSLCVGGTVSLASTVAGGTWSMTNSHATITTAGLLHGASGGLDTAVYTFMNTCGTAAAQYEVTINAVPSAGILSGASIVCGLATATLTPTVTGGTWSASNSHATVAGGIVTGVTPGTVTISYVLTNTCGSLAATKTMTVSTLPIAGTITGVNNVCEEATTILFDTVAGGTWSTSNSNAGVTAGVVNGVLAGTVTISYTVTNACGSAVATYAVTINPLPATGTIMGASTVCIGDSTTLTPTVSGGIWSASNGNAAVTGGVVTGSAAGTVVIYYSTTNSCGTMAATKTLTVEPLPDPGIITGTDSVCTGDTILLTDTVAGGTWSCTDTTAMVIGGIVTGMHAAAAVVTYTVTNACGSGTTTRHITVHNCGVNVHAVPDNAVQIFPNPVTYGLLNIVADPQDYKTYTITDNTGRIVSHGAITQKNTVIDIGITAPGTYYIQLTGSNGTIQQKIMRL